MALRLFFLTAGSLTWIVVPLPGAVSNWSVPPMNALGEAFEIKIRDDGASMMTTPRQLVDGSQV